jgi:probable F420-dependent oxidoreductase
MATETVRLGAGFPHQIGTDPEPIRDFVLALERAGFDHLSVIDHVVGAHADRFGGPVGDFPRAPYTSESPTHEVLTLLSYLAAITTRLELATGVLVLPQRETLLAAKQAAEVALLSRGRLRLALGVGWNFAEFEALRAEFGSRGARIEEQVAVMRKLWTEPLVTFAGRWHRLDRIALNPLPGRAIPIWLGSGAREVSLRRLARLAEGWLPMQRAGADLETTLARLRRYLAEAGRDPDAFGLGLGLRLAASRGEADDWRRRLDELRALGATHVTVQAGGPGVTVAEQLDRLLRCKAVLEAG